MPAGPPARRLLFLGALLVSGCKDPASDLAVTDLSGRWGPAPQLFLEQTDGLLEGTLQLEEGATPVEIAGAIDASVVHLASADGELAIDGHVSSHFAISGSLQVAGRAREPLALERETPVPSDLDLATLAGTYDLQIRWASDDSPLGEGGATTAELSIGPDAMNTKWSGRLTVAGLPGALGVLYSRRARVQLEGFEGYIDLSVTPMELHLSGAGRFDFYFGGPMTRRTGP